MKFSPTPLAGSFLIEPELRSDARGFFGRIFCEKEFAAHGLETQFVQMSHSGNTKRGTLRGMHYQLPPAQEVKIVSCFRGEIFDIILDLRPDSATFGQSFGAVLSAENRVMMYAPRGFAHGFVSLVPDSEMLYMMSDFHNSECERGVRFDDPRFNIQWPIAPVEISDKDRAWPDFNPKFHLGAA